MYDLKWQIKYKIAQYIKIKTPNHDHFIYTIFISRDQVTVAYIVCIIYSRNCLLTYLLMMNVSHEQKPVSCGSLFVLLRVCGEDLLKAFLYCGKGRFLKRVLGSSHFRYSLAKFQKICARRKTSSWIQFAFSSVFIHGFWERNDRTDKSSRNPVNHHWNEHVDSLIS